ncbi:tRNA 5-methylaminomethyl-2-thiouridine biosynthesis bifunctional protein [Orbus hercynius]|uniref:tRNA 5-methylaminomethyl-2-thiouridine biosynthesis bifunctional protein n=1 Tax=Orbus hercynius TaxID=593135 RepID=A0A495RCS1_9GAMM|nr:tRNA (5-methylaminomethyl-2-thiouridine)(34)-methyltransferase MnmD [Orbus hercynius]RKS85080.1 tRNA 5-methylaminomethyl-2-thiouridine biosynthesis bifunctional protein [Orbus hercynius]
MNTNNVVWNNSVTPISIHFDDVYFNTDDAIAETTYVFIDGNHLSERFIAHTKSTFTIGETGFGSGLNFLIAWHYFLQFKQQHPNHVLKHLQFFSIEKYPLSLTELTTIHRAIIQEVNLANLAQILQNNWPCAHYQNEQVTLNVYFADIMLFSAHLKQSNTLIDAWFFDGFSPTKNPEMWSAPLFHSLYAQTAKSGTFATFTAASYARRNLLSAGFEVYKHKGYGKKREMLIGYKKPQSVEC